MFNRIVVLLFMAAMAVVGCTAALGDHVAMEMGTYPPMEAGLLDGSGFTMDATHTGNLTVEVDQTADVEHPVDGKVPVSAHITVEADGVNLSSAWVYDQIPVSEFYSAEEDTGCGCAMG